MKEYFKKLLENNFNKIPSSTEIEMLVDDDRKISIESLKDVLVTRILLPEDVTPKIKEILSFGKSGVYTNPDICLELSLGKDFYYEPIELKTTKTDSIPGSSIQQVTPDEWVIFIKFSTTTVDITTGQYINAINSKMQFPDRSPRPQVSFKEMRNWNTQNRFSKEGVLGFKKDDDNRLKYELLSDWQNVLSKRWVDILLNSHSTKNNEPWFNNTLRKFIIDFLGKYDDLALGDQEALKEKIKSLIQ